MMDSYKTVSGDTWDKIAYNVYGNERYASELVEANTNYIVTVVFSAGIVLNIPLVSDKISSDSLLPPWKRGDVNVSS